LEIVTVTAPTLLLTLHRRVVPFPAAMAAESTVKLPMLGTVGRGLTVTVALADRLALTPFTVLVAVRT
jgi:hypothetical protein